MDGERNDRLTSTRLVGIYMMLAGVLAVVLAGLGVGGAGASHTGGDSDWRHSSPHTCYCSTTSYATSTTYPQTTTTVPETTTTVPETTTTVPETTTTVPETTTTLHGQGSTTTTTTTMTTTTTIPTSTTTTVPPTPPLPHTGSSPLPLMWFGLVLILSGMGLTVRRPRARA